MDLLFTVLCACLWMVSHVEGVKKCRINCEETYKPVCGHDARLGYQTFCSAEALSQCNHSRGNNYTRVADGPCYPSVRVWRTQSTTSDEDLSKQEKVYKKTDKQLELDLKKNSTHKKEMG